MLITYYALSLLRDWGLTMFSATICRLPVSYAGPAKLRSPSGNKFYALITASFSRIYYLIQLSLVIRRDYSVWLLISVSFSIQRKFTNAEEEIQVTRLWVSPRRALYYYFTISLNTQPQISARDEYRQALASPSPLEDIFFSFRALARRRAAASFRSRQHHAANYAAPHHVPISSEGWLASSAYGRSTFWRGQAGMQWRFRQCIEWRERADW